VQIGVVDAEEMSLLSSVTVWLLLRCNGPAVGYRTAVSSAPNTSGVCPGRGSRHVGPAIAFGEFGGLHQVSSHGHVPDRMPHLFARLPLVELDKPPVLPLEESSRRSSDLLDDREYYYRLLFFRVGLYVLVERQRYNRTKLSIVSERLSISPA